MVALQEKDLRKIYNNDCCYGKSSWYTSCWRVQWNWNSGYFYDGHSELWLCWKEKIPSEVRVTEEEASKEDAAALYAQKDQMAWEVIVTALIEKLLRVFQNAKFSREMSAKLRTRYEAASATNKISLVTSLIYTRLKRGKDLCDYIDKLETYFNKLAVMWLQWWKKCKSRFCLCWSWLRNLWKAL